MAVVNRGWPKRLRKGYSDFVVRLQAATHVWGLLNLHELRVDARAEACHQRSENKNLDVSLNVLSRVKGGIV
jgi:anti-sigma factor RsiW